MTQRENASRPTTLAEMLAAGKFSSVAEEITEADYPVNPKQFTTKGSKRYRFDRDMTKSEVAVEIVADGHKPGPIERILAERAEHPEERHQQPLVAIAISNGDDVKVDPASCVPYLDGNALSLSCALPDGLMAAHCTYIGYVDADDTEDEAEHSE